MFRSRQAIQLSVLSIALAAAGGCATVSGGHARGHDVHATARIAGDAARVLVSGHAWLMHVDVEGRDDLALYAVARKGGTDADCVAARPTVEKKRLRTGVPNRVNLNVAAGETICIAAAGTRTASVMWHARRLDTTPVAGPGQALALDGAAR